MNKEENFEYIVHTTLDNKGAKKVCLILLLELQLTTELGAVSF